MTVDTETIRAGLEMLPNNAGEEWCRANAAALAALGRVEAQQSRLEKAAERQDHYAETARLDGDDAGVAIYSYCAIQFRMEAAALAGSVAAGSGEE